MGNGCSTMCALRFGLHSAFRGPTRCRVEVRVFCRAQTVVQSQFGTFNWFVHLRFVCYMLGGGCVDQLLSDSDTGTRRRVTCLRYSRGSFIDWRASCRAIPASCSFRCCFDICLILSPRFVHRVVCVLASMSKFVFILHSGCVGHGAICEMYIDSHEFRI